MVTVDVWFICYQWWTWQWSPCKIWFNIILYIMCLPIVVLFGFTIYMRYDIHAISFQYHCYFPTYIQNFSIRLIQHKSLLLSSETLITITFVCYHYKPLVSCECINMTQISLKHPFLLEANLCHCTQEILFPLLCILRNGYALHISFYIVV